MNELNRETSTSDVDFGTKIRRVKNMKEYEII